VVDLGSIAGVEAAGAGAGVEAVGVEVEAGAGVVVEALLGLSLLKTLLILLTYFPKLLRLSAPPSAPPPGAAVDMMMVSGDLGMQNGV